MLSGAEVASVLDDLARLRIAVFREWPYLYDGDLDYERRYLSSYADAPSAALVGAFEGAQLVGAATGLPLTSHSEVEDLRLPKTAPALETIYYCAESVLLPAYRGRGVGHRFFDLREAVARKDGFTTSIFAAVIRPDAHPKRPETYRPLDPFWRKRGYCPMEGAALSLSWKDLGESDETTKDLQLWSRAL